MHFILCMTIHKTLKQQVLRVRSMSPTIAVLFYYYYYLFIYLFIRRS